MWTPETGSGNIHIHIHIYIYISFFYRYPSILVAFSVKNWRSSVLLQMDIFLFLDLKSYAHTFSVDLWSLRPLRMLLPLPRRSSMPLCALCKLEFNCRVSSMGMEVSASFWTRTNKFIYFFIPRYSTRKRVKVHRALSRFYLTSFYLKTWTSECWIHAQ